MRFLGWYWSIPWTLFGPFMVWHFINQGERGPAAVAGVFTVVAALLVARLWKTRPKARPDSQT
jgi:hypothetical protein